MPGLMLKPGYCIHGVPYHTCALEEVEWQKIHTDKPDARADASFSLLSKQTTAVDVVGPLYLWAVEQILEKAPNLQLLRTSPSNKQMIGPRHKALLYAHGVMVTFKRARKKKTDPPETKHYKRALALFKTLTREQKQKLSELEKWRFVEVKMVEVYVGLNGHTRQSTSEIASAFDISESTATCHINGFLKYLNPDFQVNTKAIKYAETLKERVVFQRKLRRAATPLFMRRLEAYSPRAHALLVDRFGLKDGVHKSYRVLSKRHNLNHFSVQVEIEKALNFIGL